MLFHEHPVRPHLGEVGIDLPSEPLTHDLESAHLDEFSGFHASP